MKYTTRPQQVEAIRYTGENYNEIYTLTDGSITKERKVIPGFTLIGDEWNQAVDVGNWVVKYDTLECVVFSDNEFKEKFEEEQ
jgi:hypothetical protein